MLNLKSLLAILVAICTLGGFAFAGSKYLAKTSGDIEDLQKTVQLVMQRLDQKILTDQWIDVQRQMSWLEEKFKGAPIYRWPAEYRKRYKQLEQKFKLIEKQLDAILKNR